MGELSKRARVTIRDLEEYKKYLKPGQKKRIQVRLATDGDIETWAEAEIVAVHREVVRVRYWIPIKGTVPPRETIREEYVKIKDLLIWELGDVNEKNR